MCSPGMVTAYRDSEWIPYEEDPFYRYNISGSTPPRPGPLSIDFSSVLPAAAFSLGAIVIGNFSSNAAESARNSGNYLRSKLWNAVSVVCNLASALGIGTTLYRCATTADAAVDQWVSLSNQRIQLPAVIGQTQCSVEELSAGIGRQYQCDTRQRTPWSLFVAPATNQDRFGRPSAAHPGSQISSPSGSGFHLASQQLNHSNQTEWTFVKSTRYSCDHLMRHKAVNGFGALAQHGGDYSRPDYWVNTHSFTYTEGSDSCYLSRTTAERDNMAISPPSELSDWKVLGWRTAFASSHSYTEGDPNAGRALGNFFNEARSVMPPQPAPFPIMRWKVQLNSTSKY